MSRIDKERKHAIVIGGGIAGLLAARVLLHHFEQVTLIERDIYPTEPVFRAGAPQGRHLHLLLLQGQHALEKLFPGLGAKLLAHGAVERMYGAEGPGASIYFYGERCPQIPPILHGWNCSRIFLEWHIHQELLKYDHLRIMEGYEAVHLLAEGAKVCGVQFRARSTDPTNDVQELRGELVVDASGSFSRIVTWLQERGYAVPQEEVIKFCVNYATRTYLPSQQAPWKEIAMQATQSPRRGGALMEIEEGRWMIVLSEAGLDTVPPIKEDDYLAFAQNLPDQALYEAVKSATPASPVYGYRKLEHRRRRFRRLPEGLIVIGDALCSFNPVYGQGMTVAAQEAILLDICLRACKSNKHIARSFQKRAARLIVFPWLLAKSADSAQDGLAKRYIDNLTALLPHDQQALLAFLHVVHMLRSPLSLVHPLLAAKVVCQYLRSRKKRRSRS